MPPATNRVKKSTAPTDSRNQHQERDCYYCDSWPCDFDALAERRQHGRQKDPSLYVAVPRDTAVVWKFAHLVHILVAAGIDRRVHLTRIHAPHGTHGGAGPTTQSDSQTSDTLLVGLLRSVRTARQR